jgi:hypothetical protein
LKKLCGTDGALYLVFLRYCALFFGLITIVNVIFLILYATGKPTEADNFTNKENYNDLSLQAFTILNITATPFKI